LREFFSQKCATVKRRRIFGQYGKMPGGNFRAGNKREEFALYSQPQVEVVTGRLVTGKI
jgi:hypothetical protein